MKEVQTFHTPLKAARVMKVALQMNLMKMSEEMGLPEGWDKLEVGFRVGVVAGFVVVAGVVVRADDTSAITTCFPILQSKLANEIRVLQSRVNSCLCGYRQAWNNKSLQILVRLLDLMSRNRFEAISAFFHVVTSDEELVNASDPLKKVRPLHNLIKTKALEH